MKSTRDWRKLLCRRWLAALMVSVALSAVWAPGYTATSLQGPPPPQADRGQAAVIVALARDAMAKYDLRAVIVRVTIDGQDLVTEALGESMTGVPATADMHFRNGAVAISYMTTLLLQLVDQKIMSLDDKLSKWLPDLPSADGVTLRMLANMTAGYPDYVANEHMVSALYADPFRQWTPQELIETGLSTPRAFAPGANWDYSHTNYVILGQALEKITGKPLAMLLQEYVLGPLGLTSTASSSTAAIPQPVLHAFSSERREPLGITPASRFYEESTYWNPSWTLAPGAIQTTNIYDMTATAIAVGEGTLLSAESHQEQVAPILLGFGAPLEGCAHCRTLDRSYNDGLGVVLSGPWILQNPLFGGYGAVEAYLPSKKIAVAVTTTFGERSFDEQGNYKHARASWEIFAEIGAYLAPEDAPSSTRIGTLPHR
jgi:CubicO group peptidase (beta-lactamase class C family)